MKRAAPRPCFGAGSQWRGRPRLVASGQCKRLVFLRRSAYYSDSRRGALGKAVAFTARSGKYLLYRQGENWKASSPDAEDQMISRGEILARLNDETLAPAYVLIEPDLAGHLFQQAVARAEESTHKANEASQTARALIGSADSTPQLNPWVLGAGAADRALRAGVEAVILAVAAAEAQVNRWASRQGGWFGDEDRLPIDKKCGVLARRAGVELQLGSGALQELRTTLKFRNSIVHSSPGPIRMPLTAPIALLSGRAVSVAGRRACLHVRNGLIQVATATSEEFPDYLAYCPVGRPEDDKVWQNAQVLTGVRKDPDFPPVIGPRISNARESGAQSET